LTNFRSNRTLEAPLPEQAVNGLDLVPALGGRDLGQVGGTFLASSLRDELYPDTVGPHLPVLVVGAVLKVAEDGHAHLQVLQFLSRHGGKSRILHGRCDGVFSET